MCRNHAERTVFVCAGHDPYSLLHDVSKALVMASSRHERRTDTPRFLRADCFGQGLKEVQLTSQEAGLER